MCCLDRPQLRDQSVAVMFTWALLVLTGGLVNEAVGQAFLTCHVPGVATGPNCITLDTLYEVATPNDCIDICQAENDCDWWSWIPSQNPTQPTVGIFLCRSAG